MKYARPYRYTAIKLFPSTYPLSNLAAWFHFAKCGGYAERTIEVYGRKYHALALYAHHLAWREVGNEKHIFARELFRLVVSSNTT